MKAEYSDEPLTYDTHETAIPTGWSAWFGGPNVKIGPRIAPQIAPISTDVHGSSSNLSSDAILNKQLEEEAGHAIQYRTCSWQKTAALLFSEYICLAIMSFPWSYSVLGLVPGLILTVVQALLVLYTSIVLWEFCLRHPEVRDVCDIGQMLFWGQKWAWYFTAFMFILNNTFIQGLHVLVGAKYLNTMVGPDAGISCQTVSFGAIVAVICWLSSLPRTFSMLSKLGTASAVFTFVSVILATIFAGIQDHPAGFNAEPATSPATGAALPFGNPIVTAVPILGTTYTFIGQITLPSFIAEMREPKDFPKALWACTILEIIVFSVVGAVTYAFVGNQYMTSPAFGSLIPLYKKVAFSFMIPTIIFLGVLYASVSARFIFFRIFQNTHHKNEHTLIGWGTWTLILFVTWVLAFVIANSIPFFNSLLALMSSLFDSFFGFIFWGLAYFRMRKADGAVALLKDRSFRGWFEGILNIIIILTGLFFLSAGTYASVQGILDEFALGTVGTAFQCASNGI
ncbi:transmembrane amino acid transporter protein-domain-containing protein [Daldinia loculata]|nr:transmembrane amino acid transporter protein-domain-containing protein [Daldinia loculata]